MTYVVGALTRDEILYNIARLLNPRKILFKLKIPGTDIDILVLNTNNEIVTVEVKSRVNDIVHLLLQLHFRKWISNRVYVAVPYNEYNRIEGILPREYGIIVYGRSNTYLIRRSAYFNYPYSKILAPILT